MGFLMIIWPQFVDQHHNEKLVVEVLGMGVAVEAKGPVMNVNGKIEYIAVRRDEAEKAVQRLMDEGETEKRGGKARELGEKATEEGGSFMKPSHS